MGRGRGSGYYDEGGVWVSTGTPRRRRGGGGGWTPRTVGTTKDDQTVTFREGLGENDGHTLIADGTPSGRSFDRRGEYNHYGENREGGGRVEESGGDRGYYTGPGH